MMSLQCKGIETMLDGKVLPCQKSCHFVWHYLGKLLNPGCLQTKTYMESYPHLSASSFGILKVGSNRYTTRTSGGRDKILVNMVVTTHINKAFMSFQVSSKILWNSECHTCKQPFKSYSYTQNDQNWLTQKTLSDSMVISGWTISNQLT